MSNKQVAGEGTPTYSAQERAEADNLRREILAILGGQCPRNNIPRDQCAQCERGDQGHGLDGVKRIARRIIKFRRRHPNGVAELDRIVMNNLARCLCKKIIELRALPKPAPKHPTWSRRRRSA